MMPMWFWGLAALAGLANLVVAGVQFGKRKWARGFYWLALAGGGIAAIGHLGVA